MAEDLNAIINEIMDELMPTLKTADTQSAAVLQFLKDKQIATEEQLAPYLQQAEDASDVRWRAARLRLEHLFSNALKAVQQSAQEQARKVAEKNETAQKAPAADTQEKESQEKKSKATPEKPEATGKPGPKPDSAAEKPKPASAEGKEDAA